LLVAAGQTPAWVSRRSRIRMQRSAENHFDK
jgi:hypothetical protein